MKEDNKAPVSPEEILSDEWCMKTPMFLPKNLTDFIMYQKQAFEAGYKAKVEAPAPSNWEEALDDFVYDLVASLSFGGFLSDRITTENAAKLIKSKVGQFLEENYPAPSTEKEDEGDEKEAKDFEEMYGKALDYMNKEDFVTSDNGSKASSLVTPHSSSSNSIEQGFCENCKEPILSGKLCKLCDDCWFESLRDRFYKECTANGAGDLYDKFPNEVFEWFKKELSALPPAVKLNSYNEAEAWCNKTPMFMPKTLQEFINFQHQAFVAGMETYQYKSVQNSALPDIEVYVPVPKDDPELTKEREFLPNGYECFYKAYDVMGPDDNFYDKEVYFKKVRLSPLSGDIEVKSDAVELIKFVKELRYMDGSKAQHEFTPQEILNSYQLFKGDANKK